MSSELIELGKNFTLLYVEDDENIRAQMKMFFEKIFKFVHIGVDGKDGLRLFRENDIDLVMTDIDMPHMNGLVMSRHIRKDAYDIPIGIISAFEDSASFLGAIDVGATKYIVKPLNKTALITALLDMVKNLQYKVDAKKFAKKKELKKINQAVKHVTKEFLKSVPSPIFVAKDGYIIYMNAYTQDLLSYKNIDMSSKIAVDTFESIFEPFKDRHYSLRDIEAGKNLDVKFLFDPKGKKFAVYTPTKHLLDDTSCIIVLNDIAPLLKQIRMVEYQKEKISLYKFSLEDILAHRFFSVSDLPIVQPSKKEPQIIDSKLSIRDIGLLRMTHAQNTITAKEFISEMDDSFTEDLQDLKNIEYVLGDAIENFEHEPSLQNIQSIANALAMSASSINFLLEFAEFANALKSLATFLFEIQEESIPNAAAIINSLLPALYSDLVSWRVQIFDLVDANDIHYLDSSIFSSILQLQVKITNSIEGREAAETDSGDMDFF